MQIFNILKSAVRIVPGWLRDLDLKDFGYYYFKREIGFSF